MDGPSLFLAGGISGTEDWQSEMISLLAGSDWTLLNPRRKLAFSDVEVVNEQIEWEFHHLRLATVRLFWFPAPTLCPITLFELGAWSRGKEPLLVGVHPDYKRRLDVEVQMSLARPEITIASSLNGLAEQALSCLEKLDEGGSL